MIAHTSKNIPSLGVQEDTVLSMRDVALIQLDESIRLFLVGRYLPAITLAGAAEEVLGKLISKQGGKSVIYESLDSIASLRGATSLTVMQGLANKEIIDRWNKTRNALKHVVVDDAAPYLRVNLCDEAYWMIRRCLANAEKLHMTVDIAHELDNWVVQNVI